MRGQKDANCGIRKPINLIIYIETETAYVSDHFGRHNPI